MTIDVIDIQSSQPVAKGNGVNIRSSPRLPVNRCLFGPIDHEELTEFLNKELDEDTEIAKQKWNFDFENETPLEGGSGRYEWTIVQSSEEVIPRFYTSSCPPSEPNSRVVTRPKTLKQTSIDGESIFCI